MCLSVCLSLCLSLCLSVCLSAPRPRADCVCHQPSDVLLWFPVHSARRKRLCGVYGKCICVVCPLKPGVLCVRACACAHVCVSECVYLSRAYTCTQSIRSSWLYPLRLFDCPTDDVPFSTTFAPGGQGIQRPGQDPPNEAEAEQLGGHAGRGKERKQTINKDPSPPAAPASTSRT